MAKKKTTTKKATSRKAAKTAAKAKKEKAPKEELCVFALRMTPAERTKLHKTAGPGRAARLARAVLNAAANKDEAAFRAALKEVPHGRA
jgi:hypothetical protein